MTHDGSSLASPYRERYFAKLLAFLRKNFVITTSYKFSLIFWVAETILQLAVFFYIAKFVMSAAGAQWEGEIAIFPFWLIGISARSLFSTALSSFTNTLRSEQHLGTLEALLITPTRLITIATGLPAWDFIWSTFNAILVVALGVVVFGVDLHWQNVGTLVIVSILTIISFYSLGLVSAGFIMVFKRGDPVSWVISLATTLLGGVFFPVDVLPKGLQYVSNFIPMKHALNALRGCLQEGKSLGDLRVEVLALAVFCVVLFPIGVLSFRYAFNRARMDGSLVHY